MRPVSTDVEDGGGIDRARRRYLGTTVAVVTAGLAGCSGILGGGGSGPETTVRDFVDALDSADGAAARDLIHPDSNLTGQFTDQQVERFYGGINVSVDSIEVQEQDGDTATVSATLTTSVDGNEESQEGQLELRRQDDEWMIYSLDEPSG